MPTDRDVCVHLLPQLAAPGRLAGSLAVAIDVLRATTTIVCALAAGCVAVRPCAEVDEARRLADALPAGKVLLGGERGGRPLAGFDLGNSPRECTPGRCKGTTLVMTTSNGTPAILRAAEAERVLIAAFVNYSAVCEQIRLDPRPLHIVCAGGEGEPCLEDTLLAGALVDFLCEETEVRLNDMPAWRGTVSRTMAASSPGRWRSARAAPTCASWGTATTSPPRPRWTASRWCRSCAATRCGWRSARWASSRAAGRSRTTP